MNASNIYMHVVYISIEGSEWAKVEDSLACSRTEGVGRFWKRTLDTHHISVQTVRKSMNRTQVNQFQIAKGCLILGQWRNFSSLEKMWFKIYLTSLILKVDSNTLLPKINTTPEFCRAAYKYTYNCIKKKTTHTGFESAWSSLIHVKTCLCMRQGCQRM